MIHIFLCTYTVENTGEIVNKFINERETDKSTQKQLWLIFSVLSQGITQTPVVCEITVEWFRVRSW